MKKARLYSIGVGLAMVLYLAGTSGVLASNTDNMESSQYRIRFGNINFGSNNQSSSSYQLGTTAGQFAANEFSSSGYIVKAGFQYIHSIIPFTFSISDTTIDLGTLIAQTPSTATADLTVAFGSAGSYQVTAEEIGPLQTSSGSSTIPDTSCNGGAQTCTESSANVWTSTSAYGFGYNMSGTSIPSDFINSTYFRPFPDSTAADSSQVVMSSANVTTSSTSTITKKTNISGSQGAGAYRTVIRFIATPGF